MLQVSDIQSSQEELQAYYAQLREQHVTPAWGGGGYTVVEGERVPMFPGDLVLTPNWTWHDHANDTDRPMIWLDGLDTPLVRMLEAGFYEEHARERQEFGAPVNASEWHYPMTEMRAALQRLAAGGNSDEIALE